MDPYGLWEEIRTSELLADYCEQGWDGGGTSALLSPFPPLSPQLCHKGALAQMSTALQDVCTHTWIHTCLHIFCITLVPLHNTHPCAPMHLPACKCTLISCTHTCTYGKRAPINTYVVRYAYSGYASLSLGPLFSPWLPPVLSPLEDAEPCVLSVSPA